MSFIYDTVKTIVFYLILVAIVMNLLGTSSYKKYVAMFTGMLLIYIIISPLMKVVNLATTMDYHTNENYYKTSVKEFSMDIADGEEEQKQYILEEYKKRIGEQISLYLTSKNLDIVQWEIMIEEDSNSPDYGRVTSVYIESKDIREGQIDKDENLIEKIVIDPIRIDKKKRVTDSSSIPTVTEIEIQKELALSYQIKEELVRIIIY